MNAQTREALTAMAVYIFIVCAFVLPFVIGYFTNAFQKRLERLDEAIEIFTETNKYHNGKEES